MFIWLFVFVTQSFAEAVKIKTQSIALSRLRLNGMIAVSYDHGVVVMCLSPHSFGKIGEIKTKRFDWGIEV